MIDKFNGSIAELQGSIAGIAGSWTSDGNGKHTFRTKDAKAKEGRLIGSPSPH